MTAITGLLLFSQVFGAFIGAASAVWGEIAYLRAIQDGEIDKAERAHLRSLWFGLYFGMTLILLSTFGLVIAAYEAQSAAQPALSQNYWILVLFALFVIGVSWALSQRRISFLKGSALVFTAWWFLAYFTAGWFPALTFGAAIAFYAVIAVVFYGILKNVRQFALRKR